MARCFAAAIVRYLAVCDRLRGGHVPLLLQAETQVTIRVANDAMERWPDGHIGRKATPTVWGFELGILLAGVKAVWSATRDPKYFVYLQHAVDQFVQPDGTIATYDPQAYSLNNILLGRELLLLYETTHQEKYRRAAENPSPANCPSAAHRLRWCFAFQGHGELMVLDDQFMLAPFYAEYAATFHEPQDLDDIVKQFTLLEQHTRDAKTGLMYHGWDESRRMPGPTRIRVRRPVSGLALWAGI